MAKSIKNSAKGFWDSFWNSIDAGWRVAVLLSQSGAAIYLGLISTYADWKVVIAAVLAASVVIDLFLLSKEGK